MKLKFQWKSLAFLIVFTLLNFQNAASQCFQIESILVDACGVQEGLNEMVRFKVGSTNLNTSNLSVTWPNNPWQGIIQNATTASKVAILNGDILDAGGCGQLIEPTAGVLPANANVILVTSFNFDTDLNSFGALTENIYIIFQNNPSTASGHFANSGTGTRTLSMSFGACSDSVTYDRNLLIDTNGATVAADGAIVLYNPAGTPTYINNGCSAPVQPFTVDAGAASLSACAGTTINLNGIAQGYQSITWSAPSGTFSAPNNLTTTYTSNASQAGNVIPITLTVVNSCGLEISDTVNLTLTNSVVPNFATTLALCTGSTAPTLNTTSPNGITGTWSPSTISNTTSGSYIFTPNSGQCATNVTLNVTVSSSITPNFATTLALCNGSTAPALNATSPNGIMGSWSPSTISNTTSGTYIFTPNSGQCATNVTLNVTVSSSITPNFATTLTLCTGSTAPTLNTTSPNGITGTWSPSTISNATSGTYVFTPNSGQCATNVTLNVTVSSSITPNFATTLALCTGSTAPALNMTSPNGITGTWSPSTISNTTSGTYIFTPNTGQCATNATLTVTVNTSITPNFATSLALCTGTTAPTLNTTSPNGITGTWSPSTINNTTSGTYIFTPNSGQCATSVTLNVTVSNSITPNFATTLALCNGSTAPALNATSPNGITGTWSPSVISNTASGTYIFTPNSGQCATSVTLNVTVSSSITPNFATTLTLCTGNTAPSLNTTSPNGITGTWSPSTISNATSGTYIFTPNAGQCATNVTLNVTVTNSITPNFATTLALCTGSTAPALNTTSPNGITGTWSPASISNTTSGTYTFTPNSGQCATNVTLNVTVTNSIVPDFETSITLCNGETAPTLSTTSPNGITGTWSPASISNTASGSYIFTPNSGQCAANVTLNVTVSTISFEINDECLDGEYILRVSPISDSFDANNADYTWLDSQGNTIGTNDSYLNITELLNSTSVIEEFPITYQVIVTNPEGCSENKSETVYSIFCHIPKGISPNNDGKNDEFDLSGLGVKEISIFNRYGLKVYGRSNYTNQWKGQSDKGDDLPDATYYYAISKSNGESITGWVYINR